jgi:natural product biosynthesis luciferase-like monooxygenase protein
MDFSLFFFAADHSNHRESYRLLLEASKLADEMGFHAVWTPERHFKAFGAPYPNPALTSAALAVITKRIMLRAGSVVLPLHNPINVAEDFSVVDNLSNGRVEIACVSGWHPDDYALAPERYQNREQLLAEGIETIRALWEGAELSLKNGAGLQRPVVLQPRPVQAKLKIWRVCQRTSSCRWAGENGINTLTSMLGRTVEQLRQDASAFKDAASANGHDVKLALMLHAFVGSDAKNIAWPAYRKYLQINLEFQKSITASLGRTFPATNPEDEEKVIEMAYGRLTTTHGLIGSVDECVAKVEFLRDLGIDEIACLIDFGVETDAVLHGLGELDRLRRRFCNDH